MKKNPLRWPVMWIACVLSVVFFVTSCDPPKELGLPNPFAPKDKGTVLLAPDLYLLDQWEKEVELNENFYSQLDSLAGTSSISGKQLAIKLDQFKKDRIALYKINGQIAENRARIVGPWGEVVLPPKSPPPPPPIIDWENLRDQIRTPVDRFGPLALYASAPLKGTFEASITQNGQTFSGTRTVLSDGMVKVEFVISSLAPGNATLIISGFNGGPPVSRGLLINK